MAYKAIKSDAKGPLWQFTGLALLALFIAWMSVLINRDNAREKEYIATPLNGDVYGYRIEAGRYSTMRVVFVAPDSVHVAMNDYETNRMTGVRGIDKDENYSQDIFGISRGDLIELYESGDIYSIDRKVFGLSE